MDRKPAYRFVLMALLLSVATVTAGAQIRIIRKSTLDSLNAPTLSEDARALEFDRIRIDAGTLEEDDVPPVYSYRFRNVSGRTLEITRLVTNCSCVKAEISRSAAMSGTVLPVEVEPGQKAQVIVRYYPKGHPGRFERRIYLYTAQSSSPAAILYLDVCVESGSDLSGLYPVQKGKIRLRRDDMNFVRGRKAVESLRYVNVSDNPITLEPERLLLPRCFTVTSEPRTVEARQEGRITVSYDPDVEDLPDGQYPLLLKGTGVPPRQSAVHLRVNLPEE